MNASFRPIHFVALLLVASGSLRADENAVHLKANKSELAKLQGSWTIVSFSQAGREFDARGLDEISKLGLVFEIKDDCAGRHLERPRSDEHEGDLAFGRKLQSEATRFRQIGESLQRW